MKGRFKGGEVVRKKTKNKLKIFDRQEYISSLDDNDLSIKEQAKIRRIETLEQCEGLITRWKNSPNIHFIRVLQQIKAGLIGYLPSKFESIEWDCYEAVCHYEKVRRHVEENGYISRRLRRSGKTNPWKVVVENTVSKPLKEETEGFKMLRESGRLDASLEVFILRNPTLFSDKAVASSYKRLLKNGWTFVEHSK